MKSAQEYALVWRRALLRHDCRRSRPSADRYRPGRYGSWQRIGENIAAGDRTPKPCGRLVELARPPRQYPEAEYKEIGVGVATATRRFAGVRHALGVAPGSAASIRPDEAPEPA